MREKNEKQGEESVYRKAFGEKDERMHRIYENSIAHSDFCGRISFDKVTRLLRSSQIKCTSERTYRQENRIMELKRVLLKLSGEALAGDKKTGF